MGGSQLWLKLRAFLVRCESGSALVETALTFPILIAMLVGAVELGDLAYKATEVTNAARAAAQYAAMNGGAFTDCNNTLAGGTCSPTRGMYLAAKSDAPWVVLKCSSFTVTAANSCSCSDGSTCSTIPATGSTSAEFSCTSPGKVVVSVAVTTSATCAPAAKLPGLFSTAPTLQGFAQQQVLQ